MDASLSERLLERDKFVVAVPPNRQRATIAMNGQNWTGQRQQFSYEQKFAGQQMRVTSWLFLFCDVRGWCIKYRCTHPAVLDMQPTVEEFVMQVPHRNE